MSDVVDANILLVGAGGLGCEVLKNLVVMGYKNMTIVDRDTIEVHNLSRQLIYRMEDCGRPKAEVAAERINARGHHMNASFVASPIQEVSISTIASFDVIISTVDNVHARRWINMAVMVIWHSQTDDGMNDVTRMPKPLLVDGGSQELYGHVRVMSNRNQPCIECSLELFINEDDDGGGGGNNDAGGTGRGSGSGSGPSCPLTNRPKTPRDCIRYVFNENWDEYNRYKTHGTYDAELTERLYVDASRYGEAHGITSITKDMVQQVLHKPVFNIGTTNSIVGALIANAIAIPDANFYFYSGRGTTVLDAFEMEKRDDCLMCSCNVVTLRTKMTYTLRQLLDHISQRVQSKDINVASGKGVIYMGTPEAFKQLYDCRMNKTLEQLHDVIDDVLYVTTEEGDAWYWVYLNFDKHDGYTTGFR